MTGPPQANHYAELRRARRQLRVEDAPFPSLATQILPSCSSTMPRQMYRPSPIPGKPSARTFDPRRVQQLGHEPAQPPRLGHDAVDAGTVDGRARVPPRLALEQLRLRRQRRQWRAQVVRRRGEEVVAQPRRLLARADGCRLVDE